MSHIIETHNYLINKKLQALEGKISGNKSKQAEKILYSHAWESRASETSETKSILSEYRACHQ